MKLRFLGKDSTPTNSPTLYASDRDSFIVQGWIVADESVRSELALEADEDLVEVPAGLMQHLAADGLVGAVGHHLTPIVRVLDSGNFVVQGKQVTDPEALGQMVVPEHETCVEVGRAAIAALLVGG